MTLLAKVAKLIAEARIALPVKVEVGNWPTRTNWLSCLGVVRTRAVNHVS